MIPEIPKAVTAIFDIGKTNKKFFLFDENYSVIKKEQITLEQTEDDDGDSCEDLERLKKWVKRKLNEVSRDQSVAIKSLNFSTYGASFVHLDKEGNALTPLYNYLKPYPKELFHTFYNTYGGKKAFSLQTASPMMGMLNSGFQLYWLKYKKPLIFQKITHSLHFPQYLSYLFTGNCMAELTSIGCHTCLWNFDEKDYHSWLKHENMVPFLPAIHPVSTIVKTEYKGLKIRTGIGIHDSSAALAPYLLALDDPFLLLSTGTWSITFNPFNNEPLTYAELQKDCLCYIDVRGNPVKSSRFFLGNEYAHQKRKIMDYFGAQKLQNNIKLDVELLNKILEQSNPSHKLQLEKACHSGPFPQNEAGNWSIKNFDSCEQAYHQLMLDLVAIQAESINLVQGAAKVDKLIITGGFSGNDFFVTLLASFFPDKKIYTSSLSDASALGAAMIINKTNDFDGKKPLLRQLLGLKQHFPVRGLNLRQYSWQNGDRY